MYTVDLIIVGQDVSVMTKIATWNCNMAFRRKKAQILKYNPDILVIQECENPDVRGDWSEFSDWRWVGDNEHKGQGVFCRNGLTIDGTVTEDSDSRYILPVGIDGAKDVLGVWAMNDENEPRRRYIGQIYTGLQQYRDFLNSDAVVAGDFNWNVTWDKSPNSPLYGNFTETVDILNEIGLVSSYHRISGSEFGSEAEPTFFMHKKKERNHHTDYIFIGKKAIGAANNFYIGSYEGWIDASDHMPVIVNF